MGAFLPLTQIQVALPEGGDVSILPRKHSSKLTLVHGQGLYRYSNKYQIHTQRKFGVFLVTNQFWNSWKSYSV